MMTRRHMIAATGSLVAVTTGAAAQTVSAPKSTGAMEIKRSGSQPSREGRRRISPARSASTRCSKRPIRRAPPAAMSPSSRARAAHGTRIRSARP